MPTRILHYPGSATRVVCSDASDLQWLVEFLRPSFWTRKSGSFEWSIELVRDDSKRRRSLKGLPQDPVRSEGVFFLDTQIEQLPVLQERPGRLTLADPAGDGICDVDSGKMTVRIVAPEHRPATRLTLMRLVRERAMRAALEDRGLLMHAAGVVVDGQSLLIAGRKRSGKTSLLVHTLRQGSVVSPRTGVTARSSSGARGTCAHYLSNDRIALRIARGSIEARGLPTIASLRTSGLTFFPDVANRVRESGFFPALTRLEARRRVFGTARPWEEAKFTMSPAQLCELTGSRAAARAPLGAVLFPRVAADCRGIRLIRLSGAAALRELRASLFRADQRLQVGDLFAHPAGGSVPSTGDLGGWIEAVVGQVGCYACELGPRAYENDAWLGRISSLLRT